MSASWRTPYTQNGHYIRNNMENWWLTSGCRGCPISRQTQMIKIVPSVSCFFKTPKKISSVAGIASDGANCGDHLALPCHNVLSCSVQEFARVFGAGKRASCQEHHPHSKLQWQCFFNNNNNNNSNNNNNNNSNSNSSSSSKKKKKKNRSGTRTWTGRTTRTRRRRIRRSIQISTTRRTRRTRRSETKNKRNKGNKKKRTRTQKTTQRTKKTSGYYRYVYQLSQLSSLYAEQASSTSTSFWGSACDILEHMGQAHLCTWPDFTVQIPPMPNVGWMCLPPSCNVKNIWLRMERLLKRRLCICLIWQTTSFVRIISELQETLLETDALHTHVLHCVCVDTLEPQLILPRPTMIQFDPSWSKLIQVDPFVQVDGLPSLPPLSAQRPHLE